jgi:nitroreductase
MSEDIGLFEAINSQRAVRYLKPDPIPESTLLRLIETAVKAPSGGNSQPWKFLIIRDEKLKERIGRYYRESWERVYGAKSSSPPPLASRVRRSATHLAENMHRAPALILACIEHNGGPSSMGRGASIYPAVQNILLAARGLGLGSALTTLHKGFEDEIKTLLNIPENVETAALLPIGYIAEGDGYGPTRRLPVGDVTFWDNWGRRNGSQD